MTNLAHIAETALMMLAAYLLGCVLGYAARRILYAGRGTRQVSAVAAPHAATGADAPLRSRRTMTPAARLAASVADEPAPPRVAAPAGKPAPKPGPAAAKSAPPKPASMPTPRTGGADNLKQIKGIGPKIETSLNELGIYHFDQIAAWSKANVDWIDKKLALKGRIARERWVAQARERASAVELRA